MSHELEELQNFTIHFSIFPRFLTISDVNGLRRIYYNGRIPDLFHLF